MTKTKTTTTANPVAEAFRSAPRIEAQLKRDGVTYLGTCVVQMPGAWTRMGPTWLVPGIGWVTYGRGLKQWGTTQGIAELASGLASKPAYHAVGIDICPAPNLVLAVEDQVLRGNKHLAPIAELDQEASEYEQNLRAH